MESFIEEVVGKKTDNILDVLRVLTDNALIVFTYATYDVWHMSGTQQRNLVLLQEFFEHYQIELLSGMWGCSVYSCRDVQTALSELQQRIFPGLSDDQFLNAILKTIKFLLCGMRNKKHPLPPHGGKTQKFLTELRDYCGSALK